jgi:hypothetical protein
MIEAAKVREYTTEVRQRVIDKQATLKCVDFNSLGTMDKIKNVIETEQLETYLQFINEFERIVLAMVKAE